MKHSMHYKTIQLFLPYKKNPQDKGNYSHQRSQLDMECLILSKIVISVKLLMLCNQSSSNNQLYLMISNWVQLSQFQQKIMIYSMKSEDPSSCSWYHLTNLILSYPR